MNRQYSPLSIDIFYFDEIESSSVPSLIDNRDRIWSCQAREIKPHFVGSECIRYIYRE